jgi:hypothetical protein
MRVRDRAIEVDDDLTGTKGDDPAWTLNVRSGPLSKLPEAELTNSVAKSSTIASRLFASLETWLLLIRSTPSCWTSFSTRRVETPAR